MQLQTERQPCPQGDGGEVGCGGRHGVLQPPHKESRSGLVDQRGRRVKAFQVTRIELCVNQRPDIGPVQSSVAASMGGMATSGYGSCRNARQIILIPNFTHSIRDGLRQ